MNTKRSNETFCMNSKAVDVFVYNIDMREFSIGHSRNNLAESLSASTSNSQSCKVNS
jgi:hypothetical protein